MFYPVTKKWSLFCLTVVKLECLFSCFLTMFGEGYMGMGGNAEMEMVTLRSLLSNRLSWCSGKSQKGVVSWRSNKSLRVYWCCLGRIALFCDVERTKKKIGVPILFLAIYKLFFFSWLFRTDFSHGAASKGQSSNSKIPNFLLHNSIYSM